MQVSGSYSAIGALTGIDPTQRTRREPRRSGTGSGDTVSISEEAKAAFRTAFGKDAAELQEEGADTAAKFRQALEDAWNENDGTEASLMGRLRSAISSWKTQPQASPAVLDKARAMQEEDALGSAPTQEGDAAARFARQFDGYRGNGIFAKQEGNPAEARAADPEDSQTAASEKSSRQAAELERKIRDLTAQLESVMASPLPEMEKNAMSTRLSKEIEELQSQLTASKQAEKGGVAA